MGLFNHTNKIVGSTPISKLTVGMHSPVCKAPVLDVATVQLIVVASLHSPRKNVSLHEAIMILKVVSK